MQDSIVLLEAGIRIKQDSILQEVQLRRMIRRVQSGRLGLWEQLMLGIGDALIGFGSRLKTRYGSGLASSVLRVEGERV